MKISPTEVKLQSRKKTYTRNYYKEATMRSLLYELTKQMWDTIWRWKITKCGILFGVENNKCGILFGVENNKCGILFGEENNKCGILFGGGK